jgi:chromosome partitioning protein
MSLVDPKPDEFAPPDLQVSEAPVVRPRIVALLNQKGGVGKTTSTVNLGAALARYGQRVLLVDLDPQSNLSLHFGVEPQDDQSTVHELLTDPEVRAADVIMNARPRLDFIPSVTELALVEGELANQPEMQHVLRRKLEPLFGSYDVVLLDCPPSLGVLSVNALTLADEVFVPMQAHYLPLRGLEKLLQTVHLVSQALNPQIKVTGVLLCMHEAQSSHSRAVIEEIESQLAQYQGTGLPWESARVLQPPIRRNIKLAEAPSFGLTIFDYAPSCPGADDYRRVALQLLTDWGVDTSHFDGKRPRKPRAPREEPAAEGVTRSARKKRAKGKAKPAIARVKNRKTSATRKIKAAKAQIKKPARVIARAPKRGAVSASKRKAAAAKTPVRKPPSRPSSRKPRRTRRALRSGGLSL